MSAESVEYVKAEGVTINEDMRFQRREWKVQHYSWLVAAVIILLALLGVMGKGPLSSATARSTGGELDVKYERFARWESQVTLDVTIHELPSDDAVQIWIEQSYFDAMRAQFITPEPRRSVTEGNRIVYEFDGETLPMRLRFHFDVTRFGMTRAQVGLKDGPVVVIQQFIYP